MPVVPPPPEPVVPAWPVVPACPDVPALPDRPVPVVPRATRSRPFRFQDCHSLTSIRRGPGKTESRERGLGEIVGAHHVVFPREGCVFVSTPTRRAQMPPVGREHRRALMPRARRNRLTRGSARRAVAFAVATCSVQRSRARAGRSRRKDARRCRAATGEMARCISSTSPALRYCRIVATPPPRRTSFPPAASRARSSAAWMPSVTK